MKPTSNSTTTLSTGSKPAYSPVTLSTLRQIPQLKRLPESRLYEMEVVANVLPFRANNYVIEQLIDWDNIDADPMFILTFPQRDMLLPEHFARMSQALKSGLSKNDLGDVANDIRLQLNPHPAGQKDYNVPKLQDGTPLPGLQHKYADTALFFPSQGQTCHAYCSFCFRWPQFVGLDELKFASREVQHLIQYLVEHPEVTDILFTGGDPMIMKTKVLASYLDAIVDARLPNLCNIRIGSKALAYWPYRFLTDDDADDLLRLFERITTAGIHLSFMAHFNHGRELSTETTQQAIQRIRSTGAQIRTQSPLLRHINDSPEIWSNMWRMQVAQGCIPYYMFVSRDTGAQHYFALPLIKAQEIFRTAYRSVTGLCRTVRGPSMSALPGKVQMLGVGEVGAERVIVLRFLRARNPEWVHQPFFAKYDEKAYWLDELQPAFGKRFFYEAELDEILKNLSQQERFHEEELLVEI